MACSGACMQEATAHLLQHRRQQLHEQCVLLVGRRGLLLLLLVLLLRLLLRRRELLADLQGAPPGHWSPRPRGRCAGG